MLLCGVAAISALSGIIVVYASSIHVTLAHVSLVYHNAIIPFVVAVVSILLNALWRGPGQLANANMILFFVLGLLELAAPLHLASSALCAAIYLAAVGFQLEGDSFTATQLVIVCMGALLGVCVGVVRGAVGRDEFIAVRRSLRQQKRCESLLSAMLPTQLHVQRLMRGENVLEVSKIAEDGITGQPPTLSFLLQL